MPIVGYGTFLSAENITDLTIQAIDAGYRHIDTASLYNNEEQIGKALKEVFSSDRGIKRGDLFITTKLAPSEKYEPKEALKKSLAKLGLDYVDLYLIHWPQNPTENNADGKEEFAKIPLRKVWQDLEEAVKEGLTKHIGISNFNLQIILDLLTYAEIKPAVNQIEIHPYLVQYDLVEYLKRLGIVVTAYSPLGNPGNPYGKLKKNLLEEEAILNLAKKYEKSPAQILLNWGIQRGHVVIPKSSTEKRLKENLESQNFQLSKEDVEAISSLNSNDRLVNPKNWGFGLNPPIFT
jgi:diketogulonate reductase-like aldo/keto reductase